MTSTEPTYLFVNTTDQYEYYEGTISLEKVPQILSAKYDTAMTAFTWAPLNIFITTVIWRINYKNYFTHSEPRALYTNLTSVSTAEDRLK